MDDQQPLVVQLAALVWNDPIIYGCLNAQATEHLSNEETLIRMVRMMADRNAHMSRVYQALSARVPSAMIESIGI